MDHDDYETRERGHGRAEYRSYTVLHSTEGIRQAGPGLGLASIGWCFSERTVKGNTTTECRFFSGDKKASANYDAPGLRHHGGIEHHGPWQLAVNFGVDDNRVPKRKAAENVARLRRLTLSLLKAHPSKDSIARKRFAAALDPSFLEEILRGNGSLAKR